MGTIKKVFILHGWTKTAERWKPFVNYLKEEGLKINLLKIPGLTDKTNKPWTLNDYVEWLKEIIGKEKNKVVLIGHSNGGRLALAFATKYQNRLSNLILLDAAGIYQSQIPLKIKKLVFKIIAKIGKKIVPSKKLRNVLYKVAGETDYKESSVIMQKTLINLISVNLKSVLSKIVVPTTIIWGEHDKVTPLSDGKLIHKMIKKSKFYIVEGARHSPQYTHPEIVADRILGEID